MDVTASGHIVRPKQFIDAAMLLVMVKIMKCNSRLASEIDERKYEKSQCDNEQDGNAVFMRQVQHGAHKRNDDQRCCDYRAHGGVEYGPVQQRGLTLKPRNVCFEI